MPERMFLFTTSQPNPIGGSASGNTRDCSNFRFCSFDCIYCWSKGLKNRFQYPKYQGSWRLYPLEMKQHKPEDFPWPCDMIDIGDPTIPRPIYKQVLSWIGRQPCPVLLLVKNPSWYVRNVELIPPNAVLGATIETDLHVDEAISRAPLPLQRLEAMAWLSHNRGNRLFICIEPIMKFDLIHFLQWLRMIKPWAVAIGYDNYGHDLPEPTLSKTEVLIKELENFTTVYKKTIRRAWDE